MSESQIFNPFFTDEESSEQALNAQKFRLYCYYNNEANICRRRSDFGYGENAEMNEELFSHIVNNPVYLNQFYYSDYVSPLPLPLELAAERGLMDLAKFILKCKPETPLSVALHHAIEKEDLQMVKLFVNSGASVKECSCVDTRISQSIVSPLFLAIKTNKIQIAEFLLENGASLNDKVYPIFSDTTIDEYFASANLNLSAEMLQMIENTKTKLEAVQIRKI